MSLQRYANAPIPSAPTTPWTVLSGAINASTTTITPLSSAAFPSLAQFDILIDDEILRVTAGGSTWTVQRGVENTTAASHADGASIYHILTAGALSRLPRSMTTLGDFEYLDATGAPARLAAPSDGAYAVTFTAGVPAWTPFSVSGLTVSNFASPNISQWTNDAGYLTSVTNISGNAGTATKWQTARNLAGNSVDGSANVAFANKFIVQGTADSGLSGAQFLGALGTGIVKNTTTTGVLSIAVAADFPTLNQNTTGNAATATALQTARAINGVNFDGTAAITVTAAAGTLTGATLASGVTASSLTSFGAGPSFTGPVTITEAVGSSGLTITGATQTASNPALNITQTWNNAGVTFTGAKINVTSTASASDSRLFDVQLAASPKFLVQKDGTAYASNAFLAVTLTGNGFYTSGQLGFGATNPSLTTPVPTADLVVTRDAADTLAQRRGTNAQTARWYNTFTDSSNGEWLEALWSGNTAYLHTKANGTGSVRDLVIAYGNSTSIAFYVPASAGSSILIGHGTTALASSNPIANITGNVFAMSGSGASLKISTSVIPTSTSTYAYYGLQIVPTINYSNVTPGAGSYEALKIAVTETALPTGQSYLGRWSAGASGTTDIYRWTNKGHYISAQVAADPSTSIVSTTDLSIYRKNSKLVIAYNNGGTMTYLTIPLDAATTSWTQSTTAP